MTSLKNNDKKEILFDETSGFYKLEEDGIIFSCDEKTEENYKSEIKITNYIKI